MNQELQATLEWDATDAQRVINYFRQNCVGYAQAKTRADISEALFPGLHRSMAERKLRAMVTELNKSGWPILSGNNGLYYSTSPDDISRERLRMQAMGQHCLDKANLYREMENKYNEIENGLTEIHPLAR